LRNPLNSYETILNAVYYSLKQTKPYANVHLDVEIIVLRKSTSAVTASFGVAVAPCEVDWKNLF
jgi:hypothetical protein